MNDYTPAIATFDFMPVEVMKRQVNLIQQAMRDIMQDGTHFGTIPGCGDKPTLLKPGAEKICLLFGLRANFAVEERNLTNNHKEFYVVCSLLARDGSVIGQGVGSASTMESKHRWRYAEAESTGIPVPGEYWGAKKSGNLEEMSELLGGKDFIAKKLDDGWMICKRSGNKVENPDVADVYNTVLKMAKKRAHVDATLTCTAASDIFTQDIEDMPIEQLQSKVTVRKDVQPKPEKAPKTPKKPVKQEPLINKDDCYLYDISAAKKVIDVEDGKKVINKVFADGAGIIEDHEGQTVLYCNYKIAAWDDFLIAEPVSAYDDDDDLPGFERGAA